MGPPPSHRCRARGQGRGRARFGREPRRSIPRTSRAGTARPATARTPRRPAPAGRGHRPRGEVVSPGTEGVGAAWAGVPGEPPGRSPTVGVAPAPSASAAASAFRARREVATIRMGIRPTLPEERDQRRRAPRRRPGHGAARREPRPLPGRSTGAERGRGRHASAARPAPGARVLWTPRAGLAKHRAPADHGPSRGPWGGAEVAGAALRPRSSAPAAGPGGGAARRAHPGAGSGPEAMRARR